MSGRARDLLRPERRSNLWQEAGGDATFRALVDAFYRRVEADPLLRPLFPADLGPGSEKQFLFLAEYFGGPARYSDRHGPPRLRLRHLPFRIGMEERGRWLAHMLAAIDEAAIAEPWRSAMHDYFEAASLAMVNAGR